MRASDKLSGLVVARWAEDFGLTGDEAWRVIREGSAEFRKIVVRHYCTAERMNETSRYVDHPDVMDQEIDEYLRDLLTRARPTRGHSGSDSTDYPGYQGIGLDDTDHESLYTADNPCRNPHLRSK